MSIQMREALVQHPHTIFRSQSQRDDLLDPTKTNTDLIALLWELVQRGHIILFTAIHSDHHDDSALNPTPPHVGTHAGSPETGGFAADTWPLASTAPDDYLDAGSQAFTQYVHDAADTPWTFQVGLAGSADTATNAAAAGAAYFSDDGGDHVHLGAR